MKLFAFLIGIFIAFCWVGSSYQKVNSTSTLKAQNETLMGAPKNESLIRKPRRWVYGNDDLIKKYKRRWNERAPS